MTKRLILALVLLCVPFVSAPIIIQQPAAGFPGDYTDINCFITWENCGGSPCVADYTLGDLDCCVGITTFTDQSVPQQSSAAATIGSFGAETTTTNDWYNWLNATEDAVFNGTVGGRIGFWFEFDANITTETYILQAQDATGTGADSELRLSIDTNNDLVLVWCSTDTCPESTCTATTSSLTAATNYFVQVRWVVNTASDDELEIFWDTSSFSCTGLTLAPFVDDLEVALIGSTNNGTGNFYIDNFIVSDDESRDLYLLRNATDEGDLSNSCGS